MKAKTTQKAEVLKHFIEKGSLTSMEAFKKYGATRLASIVHDLRKQGHDIETITMEGSTRYGGYTQYAKYVYHKGPKERKKTNTPHPRKKR